MTGKLTGLLRTIVDAFKTRQEAVTAIEFALLAPPLIALIIGSVQAGISYYYYSLMENASFAAARTLREAKGDVQKAGDLKEIVAKTIRASTFSDFDVSSLQLSVEPILNFDQSKFKSGSSAITTDIGVNIITIRMDPPRILNIKSDSLMETYPSIFGKTLTFRNVVMVGVL